MADRRRVRRQIEAEELKLQLRDVQVARENLELQHYHDQTMFGINLMVAIAEAQHNVAMFKFAEKKCEEETRGIEMDNQIKAATALQIQVKTKIDEAKLQGINIENQQAQYEFQLMMRKNPLS